MLPTAFRRSLLAAGLRLIDPDARLRELERQSGGRLGVAILDTQSGAHLAHRAGDRFPMCSTFKLLACACVLARVDRAQERLGRRISFTDADLLEYAPVTRAHVGEGGMTVGDLCHAAMTVSDNTAANLILATYGGPAGLTRYLRSLGDRITRLDRNEPSLNEALPGDARDTTTPLAMRETMQKLLLGPALSSASREQLTAWLVANTTGNARLRAGLPAAWRVGDKTGTGNAGSTNDVAIITPPGRRPILVTAYLTGTSQPADVRESVLKGIGALVANSVPPA
jgi:beta-lactamase class A